MFGRNLGGQSTFGLPAASTPTSTPAPSMNNQLPQKTGGLFGNTATNFGTSTPSPSGTFGNQLGQNKPAVGAMFGNATNNAAAPTTNNNLFGNSATTNVQQPNTAGGLFKATAPATSNPNSGSLFGNSNTTTTGTTTGGLFGNATKPVVGGGLFGNNNATTQPNTQSGSLFGNSNTTAKTVGTSLFGNSTTSNTQPSTTGLFGNSTCNNTATTGSLFGNKPATTGVTGTASLFGNKPQVGTGLFGNSTQTNAIGSAPTSSGVKYDFSNMPKAITPAAPKLDAPSMRSHDNRSSFSAQAINPIKSQVLPSNIFGKLNTRLKYVKEKSTKGIFSSSSKDWSYLPYNKQDISIDRHSNNSSHESKHLLALKSVEDQRIKNLRVLRIDPNRSAAKKLKLLPNSSVPTQEVIQTINNLKHNTNDQNVTDKDPTNSHHDMKEGSTADQSSTDNVENVENVISKDTESQRCGYWCSPSPDELRELSTEQLTSVSNFMIGRKGHGTISFNYDVDLTAFARDIEGQLFGKTVNFNSTKTVEVYPDYSTKPPVGYGINVPATISIEGVYSIDKKTKKPHVNSQKSSEIQLLIRRLKSMKDMEFISYNPFGGVWTFRVNHFSIWGLVDSEDVEIDENDLKEEEELEKRIQKDQLVHKRTLAQSNLPQGNQRLENNTQDNLLALQNQSFANGGIDTTELEDDGLIEEKAFEPQVDEEDIELMEVEPSLEVVDNWVEQLRIAGTSNNSVFNKIFSESKVEENPMTLLFSDFNENFEKMKKISKERRITSNYTFASFDSNSKLSIKTINRISGVKISSLDLSLDTFNLVMNDNVLGIHLKSVETTKRDSNEFPRISKHSLTFTNILPLVPQTSSDYDAWKLCSILFDDIEIPLQVDNKTVKVTLTKKLRFESLTAWVLEQIKNELMIKIKTCADPLDIIFYYLFLNDNVNAAKIAMESNNAYLPVILSLLGSNDPRVIDFAAHQLEAWKSSGHQIEPKIRRIYEIIGETFFQSSSAVNDLLEEFSWLAVFGLGLFYGKVDENSLQELVLSILSMIPASENDLTYIVLQLFSADTSVEHLFKTLKDKNPQLSTQFSWYFVQILRHKDSTNFSDIYSDLLTLDMIEELRAHEFVEQELFVSCFLNSDRVAKQQISNIVTRNISRFHNGAGIVNKLEIPKSLVFSASAFLDKYNGNYLSALENLLNAGSYKDAQQEMMLCVGPKLILKFNVENDIEVIETLKRFLEKFPKEQIDDWRNTLQVYEEFSEVILKSSKNNDKIINIKNSLKQLMKYNDHKLVPACCNIMEKNLKAIQI
ncbi:hypothetical protein C6P45_002374 [Maudiozyma exigua]|uniref:Peptidase S59 domain-containing protein n=1 Tax=Maudiozyma exigua TaxID=34358 RepID=A0A9P6WFI5_MAUEX|nr:hypothetical protein C6P45_002374 [Kazachstania exigua]